VLWATACTSLVSRKTHCRSAPGCKAPGRHLLLATSAAEEGLDLPACQAVVRFSVAASGIQRAQSRGRARQRASRYLSLVSGWQEAALHSKAVAEERNMVTVMRGLELGGSDGV
jgi:ERCC4-related helicase